MYCRIVCEDTLSHNLERGPICMVSAGPYCSPLGGSCRCRPVALGGRWRYRSAQRSEGPGIPEFGTPSRSSLHRSSSMSKKRGLHHNQGRRFCRGVVPIAPVCGGNARSTQTSGAARGAPLGVPSAHYCVVLCVAPACWPGGGPSLEGCPPETMLSVSTHRARYL